MVRIPKRKKKSTVWEGVVSFDPLADMRGVRDIARSSSMIPRPQPKQKMTPRQEKIFKDALTEASNPEPEPDDPFDYQVPPTPRGKIYNPRFRRWEWEDTGEPVDAPTVRAERDKPRGVTIEEIRKQGFRNGQYYGYPLSQVPSEYLRNFLGMASDKGLFYQAVQKELRSRNED